MCWRDDLGLELDPPVQTFEPNYVYEPPLIVEPPLVVVVSSEAKSRKRRRWAQAVRKRDGYRCVECGAVGILHAHHRLGWADHPESRFDVANGVTLCRDCHALEHPKLRRLILAS